MEKSLPLFALSERVVVVTGGGKGLGKVYCRHLADAGARVVVADIDSSAADDVATEITASGGQALSCHLDVTLPESAASMAAATIARFGRIDGLINNAALMSVLPRRAWYEIDVDEWDHVMAVNLKGVFLCCRAVYPQMKQQRSGRIVNVSSGRIFEGTPFRLHYTSSKAGIVGFTRALAREVGDDNIAVNAISPGLTLSETQLASTASSYLSDHDKGRAFKRPQVPDDLVGTVMFLLSDASGFITGQTINVDGGRSMH